MKWRTSGRIDRCTVRLTDLVSFGSLHLTNSINRFVKLNTKLSVQLQLTDNLTDLIVERIDLAIRITCNPAPNLVASSLYLQEHGIPKVSADLDLYQP